MLVPLLLSLGLVYYSSSVRHATQTKLTNKLKELTRHLELSDNVRRRVNEMYIVNDTYTFTVDKREIHLHNSKDKNSMIVAAIHELAHVVCDDLHHTSKFYSIENELLQRALTSKLIHNTKISSDYPCIEHKHS